MAQGLNRVILIGNLGQDPELKRFDSGSAVLTLRLATSEKFKDRSGDYKERTEWHTVKVWGKRAEALGNILGKGRSICVEGSIRYESWEDKDGNKRISPEINAREIVLLGGRGERSNSGGGDYQPRGGGQDPFGDDDLDGIPF